MNSMKLYTVNKVSILYISTGYRYRMKCLEKFGNVSYSYRWTEATESTTSRSHNKFFNFLLSPTVLNNSTVLSSQTMTVLFFLYVVYFFITIIITSRINVRSSFRMIFQRQKNLIKFGNEKWNQQFYVIKDMIQNKT